MVTKEMTFEEAGFTRETIDVKELLEFRRKQEEINKNNVRDIKVGDYISFQLTIFDFDPNIPNEFKPKFISGIMQVTEIKPYLYGYYLVTGKDEFDMDIFLSTESSVVEGIEYNQLVKGVALKIFGQTEYGFYYRYGFNWNILEDELKGLNFSLYDSKLEDHILNAMIITGEN